MIQKPLIDALAACGRDADAFKSMNPRHGIREMDQQIKRWSGGVAKIKKGKAGVLLKMIHVEQDLAGAISPEELQKLRAQGAEVLRSCDECAADFERHLKLFDLAKQWFQQRLKDERRS